ncbi:hypothetical protein CFAM422_002563 [Trichoderma lentiforme]|uniref:Uncharacterized protein n=1 Tax=Trichoderma lentiforme TaxID=1567552 RepID=A0A9P5CEF0_9HYPO|nr:hypothetical protein CFAM422_002563 [Trichoderma lentiforme]
MTPPRGYQKTKVQSSHSCKTPPWTRSTKRTRLVEKSTPMIDRLIAQQIATEASEELRKAATRDQKARVRLPVEQEAARFAQPRYFLGDKKVIGGALWTRTLSVNWRQADKKRSQSQQNLVSFGSRGGSSLAAHCGSSFEG